MANIYYRCFVCHSKIVFEVPGDGSKTIIKCYQTGAILHKSQIYRCQHNYWWELLYLRVRWIFRVIRDGANVVWNMIKDIEF